MHIEPFDDPLPVFGSGLGRKEGCHVTDVIRYIEMTLGQGGSDSPPEPMITEPGFWWERVQEWRRDPEFLLGKAMAVSSAREKDGAYSQLSLEVDGIQGTPDYIPWDEKTGLFIVEEYKFTRMKFTENFQERKFWRWLVQMMSYVQMVRVCQNLPCNQSILRPYWVMGDYSRPTKPIGDKSYLFTWDEEELKQNWQMIVANAKVAGLLA